MEKIPYVPQARGGLLLFTGVLMFVVSWLYVNSIPRPDRWQWFLYFSSLVVFPPLIAAAVVYLKQTLIRDFILSVEPYPLALGQPFRGAIEFKTRYPLRRHAVSLSLHATRGWQEREVIGDPLPSEVAAVDDVWQITFHGQMPERDRLGQPLRLNDWKFTVSLTVGYFPWSTKFLVAAQNGLSSADGP